MYFEIRVLCEAQVETKKENICIEKYALVLCVNMERDEVVGRIKQNDSSCYTFLMFDHYIARHSNNAINLYVNMKQLL